MFNIGTIQYAVGGGGGPFGGDASLGADLLHAWDFESNANDLVGSNNGTVSGATLGAYGKYLNAYSFDGINDLITITALAATAKSFSCWARKSSTGNYGRVLGNSGGTKYLFQLYGNNTNYCNLGTGTLSWAQTDDTVFHHYVVTADGTTIKIYVDNVLKINTTNSGVLTGFDQIGRYSSTNSTANNWRGTIDEMTIWSKVIDATDVSNLYASGSGLFYNS